MAAPPWWWWLYTSSWDICVEDPDEEDSAMLSQSHPELPQLDLQCV